MLTGAGPDGFAAAIRGAEAEIDLAVAALEIARIETPDLVVAQHLARLDRLAARSGVAAGRDRLRALHRLREFLFEEEGFAGNRQDYYDPRNSCLDQVLHRRLGIPITLAVLMIEVGRRVGLPLQGVGLPGHFLVQAEVTAEPVLLDPFEGGALVTAERAAELMRRALGRAVELSDRHLAPVGRRAILVRMLNNLRGIYLRRRDWTRALAVLDRLVLLDGEAPGHLRDRGAVLVKLGRLDRGVADLERYLRCCGEAEDAEAVRRQLRQARQQLATLN